MAENPDAIVTDAKLEEQRRFLREIIDAATELHTERGVLATSWEDIARKADGYGIVAEIDEPDVFEK